MAADFVDRFECRFGSHCGLLPRSRTREELKFSKGRSVVCREVFLALDMGEISGNTVGRKEGWPTGSSSFDTHRRRRR